MKKRIIFLCTHNSARSQMAEGLLRHYQGDKYDVYSAGTHPTAVHPLAVTVMAEIGIDISAQRSKGLDAFKDERFDLAITLCDGARAECPVLPGAARMEHHGFMDPDAFDGTESQKVEKFRMVRDEIRDWIMLYFADDIAPRKMGVNLGF